MKRDSEAIFPDLNVLIALAWRSHPCHKLARARFDAHPGPWLTCAVTQLGFIRLLSNIAVTKSVVSPGTAVELLRLMTEDRQHVFVRDEGSITLTPLVDVLRRAMGHNQVTDAYLLNFAATQQACFVSFDSRLTALAAGICRLEILGISGSRV